MMVRYRPGRGRTATTLAVFALVLGAAALSDARLATAAARAPHALVAAGLVVTALGTSGYMFAASASIALAAIASLRRGHKSWRGVSLRLTAERALYVFAAIAVSGILAQVFKHVVGRARPRLFAVDGAFRFQGPSLQSVLTSFPSGHTTSAFAAAVALGYMKPEWRGWLLLGAVLIGLSRILVGAHYPSDVVGGAALGGLVSVWLSRSFARRGIAFTSRAGRTVVEPLRARA